MAYDINQTVILGRLTRDPEITFTKSNKQVCKFSIANNQGKGDNPADVNFFNIVAWEKLAETVGKYLKKGSQCIIAGQLKQNRWQNEEGKTRSVVEIVARTVQFIGGKSDSEGAPAMTGQPQEKTYGSDAGSPDSSSSQENFDSEPLGNDETPF